MPKGRSGIITEEFKGKENTAYHDVEKLFKIYRSVNWKMQIKINQVKRHFQLEYGTDVDKFLDSLYQAGMDVDTDLASEKERVESINHSILIACTFEVTDIEFFHFFQTESPDGDVMYSHKSIWTFRLEEMKEFYIRYFKGTSNEKIGRASCRERV